MLDDELIADLRARIRSELSPRHVPAAIGQVNRMPRTKSGKLVEIAVRTIVNGGTVAETGALDDASALDEFVDHPCLARSEPRQPRLHRSTSPPPPSSAVPGTPAAGTGRVAAR